MSRTKRPEFSKAIQRVVIERSGNRCERCGIDFDNNFKGEFHHVIPVIFGGKSTIDNCSLLCKKCHYVAPNLRNKEKLIFYKFYFLRFASFKEAAKYYGVNNRFDLYLKLALDFGKNYGLKSKL
jgi:hypothetical protein